MSSIPSTAMPHAYAEEGVDLRDPSGRPDDETPRARRLPTGLLLGAAGLIGYLVYRAVR